MHKHHTNKKLVLINTVFNFVLPVFEDIAQPRVQKFNIRLQTLRDLIKVAMENGFPFEDLKRHESELRANPVHALPLDEWEEVFGRQWKCRSTYLAVLTCVILVAIASDGEPLASQKLEEAKVFENQVSVALKGRFTPECVANARKLIDEIMEDDSSKSSEAVTQVIRKCLQHWPRTNLKKCGLVNDVLDNISQQDRKGEIARLLRRRTSRKLKETLEKIFPNGLKGAATKGGAV